MMSKEELMAHTGNKAKMKNQVRNYKMDLFKYGSLCFTTGMLAGAASSKYFSEK